MKKNTIEMGVGLFIVAGFLAFVYLALNLGEVSIFSGSKNYTITAEFDNVSGVKKGAVVQIAGVAVGEVSKMWLGEDEVAILLLKVSNNVKIPVDSMASVKSTGIIGDKIIQLSLGGDDELLEEGGVISDTESSVDIESLISKFAFGSAE